MAGAPSQQTFVLEAQARPARGMIVPALLVAAAYYVGANVGFAFTLQPSPISTLWPPNAILLAALLLAPVRAWWLFVAAVFPAHVAAELQSGVPFAMVLGWFASNCSEALLGAGLTRVVLRRVPRFDSLHDVGVFVVCGVLISPLASSFLDAAFVRWVGWGEGTYWHLIRVRFFSNALAALTLVPLIATWATGGFQALRGASGRRRAEAAFVLLGLLGVCVLLFDREPLSEAIMPALFYAPLPFLLWAAVRLGPLGTSSAIFVMAMLAVWGAVNGYGPFVQGIPEESARAMQLFLIAVSLPLLLLSVVLEERARVERQAQEKQLQLAHLSRVATLGTLSGALAHELNQPLTAILSNAQAAQRFLSQGGAAGGEIAEILGDIVAEDRRAGEVVRRLRALFQRGELQQEVLDVNSLVRDVLRIADSEIKMRGIRVAVYEGASLPAVRADRVQLQQVLLNLVLNACEAMAGGARDARELAVRSEAAAPSGVQVCVADTGEGVPAELREAIFEPFYTTKPVGLGLGLSISRSIVEAHGGRLWCREASRRGATFCMVLPGHA